MNDKQEPVAREKTMAVLAPEPKPGRAPTLYFIVGVKLVKGLGALLLALGAFRLTDNNLPEDFRKLLEFLHLDPEKRFFVDMADHVSQITSHNLKTFGAGAIVYGCFMLLQAVGLALRASWAVWLVIAESAFFIPIEVYELFRQHTAKPEVHHLWMHPKLGVAIVLFVNVAIVWYLFENRGRIIRHHQRRQRGG
jgi:uncharacterized membrane protein (DUF2068 family)